MAKYKFRFQSILSVKEIMEKKIQEEISVINMEIEDWKKKLFVLNEEKEKIIKKVSEGSAKVSEYQSMKMYVLQIENQIDHTNKEIANCIKRREQKQKELVEKKKEIKSFETLKENDYQNYLTEERKNELKMLNEVALRNFSGDPS